MSNYTHEISLKRGCSDCAATVDIKMSGIGRPPGVGKLNARAKQAGWREFRGKWYCSNCYAASCASTYPATPQEIPPGALVMREILTSETSPPILRATMRDWGELEAREWTILYARGIGETFKKAAARVAGRTSRGHSTGKTVSAGRAAYLHKRATSKLVPRMNKGRKYAEAWGETVERIEDAARRAEQIIAGDALPANTRQRAANTPKEPS